MVQREKQMNQQSAHQVTWGIYTKHLGDAKEGAEASLVAQMVKNLPAVQETWVQSLDWEDSTGEGNGYPLQYSYMENFMDRGTWWVARVGHELATKSPPPKKEHLILLRKRGIHGRGLWAECWKLNRGLLDWVGHFSGKKEHVQRQVTYNLDWKTGCKDVRDRRSCQK